MRQKAWHVLAILAAALLPQLAQAQENEGLSLMGWIDSLQLTQRPVPIETEPFNQPLAMNGNCILNYYQTDAVVMRRSAGSFNGGEPDWSIGPRLILGRGMSDRDAIEIGYFAQYQMNANVFAPGVNGFTANNREDYRSEMNSAELNWRHWLTPELSVIAGFRYLNWHENLNAAFDTVSPLPPGSVNQAYHTSNNLFGFQTGGDWKHAFNDRFGIEIGSKVGVYGTRTEMDGTLGIPGIGAVPCQGRAARQLPRIVRRRARPDRHLQTDDVFERASRLSGDVGRRHRASAGPGERREFPERPQRQQSRRRLPARGGPGVGTAMVIAIPV